jgi:hypothetical protein
VAVVKTPFASKGISQPLRRRIDLAIAVAQERLLSTHVEHALELIELVGDQVPFDDALDIYTRLLRLTEDEARIITTRALAYLGEDRNHRKTWPERMAEADAAAKVNRARFGIIGNLRHRLRGRINEELRRWIELEAARTEVALIGAHVENALNFVDILEPELPFTEAVQLYLEALDVRESIGEVVYYFTLTRLNDRLIPDRRAKSRGTAAAASQHAARAGGAVNG